MCSATTILPRESVAPRRRPGGGTVSASMLVYPKEGSSHAWTFSRESSLCGCIGHEHRSGRTTLQLRLFSPGGFVFGFAFSWRGDKWHCAG
jgi:hypothetical protein